MVKRPCVRQKLFQSELTGETTLCPPETISAQASMVKRRYVHQKLHQQAHNKMETITRFLKIQPSEHI